VQGRGATGERIVAEARALQDAGAFAVVLEMVPAETARKVTAELTVPTIGIGAGPDCDAQVNVWQDMAGLRPPPRPRFVRPYADLRDVLARAAAAYGEDVRAGRYPGPDESYE
jgi:3-methyl-2-oxobutanoate hydroxymethyltransferase